MTNKQQIPWLRIGAESVAIVGSILLAFLIDAAWNNYQDRREEHEILLGLQDEFTRHIATIEENMRRVRRITDSISFLLKQDDLDFDSLDSIEVVEQAVFHSGFTTPSDEMSGGVRDALFESGNLDLIRNVRLKQALVKWPASVGLLEQQRENVSGFVMQTLLPHLSYLGVPLAELRMPTGNRLADRRTSTQELGAKYAALLANQEYLNLITVRIWWAFGTLQDYQNAADNAQEIIDLVKMELETVT